MTRVVFVSLLLARVAAAAPAPAPAGTVVVARLVARPEPVNVVCGVLANVETMRYEVVRVESGAPLRGSIEVGVLCPEQHKASFTPGAVHRLKLHASPPEWAKWRRTDKPAPPLWVERADQG